MSMAECFRLEGLSCPRGLRRTLDCALVPVDSPTAERYAAFSPDWRGDCRLHRESDGLCGIQRECGEDALPSVCRMYPRAVRTRWADECSCSCGCEAVSDLLMARPDPLDFTEAELTVPLEPERSERSGLIAEFYRPVRDKCLSLIQDRSYTLNHRLDMLGALAMALDGAFSSRDRAAISNALECDYTPRDGEERFDLSAAKLTANFFGRRSRTLSPYAEAAAEYYGTGGGIDTVLPDPDYAARRFAEAEARRPAFESAAENLLANWMFYRCFPFSPDGYGIAAVDAALALRALYLLLRYVTAAADDSAYAVFRVADNSDFSAVAPKILRRARESCGEHVFC